MLKASASTLLKRGLLGNRAKGRRASTGQQLVRPSMSVSRAGDHLMHCYLVGSLQTFPCVFVQVLSASGPHILCRCKQTNRRLYCTDMKLSKTSQITVFSVGA